MINAIEDVQIQVPRLQTIYPGDHNRPEDARVLGKGHLVWVVVGFGKHHFPN
jgi:hypothetical protein